MKVLGCVYTAETGGQTDTYLVALPERSPTLTYAVCLVGPSTLSQEGCLSPERIVCSKGNPVSLLGCALSISSEVLELVRL